MYGLTKKQFDIFMKILSVHKDEISEVKIFGSRARGDYKKTSDIDIAVKFLRPIQGILAEEFEKSNFPYNADIINLETALEKNIYEDELYLDGLIQRFEFCFEISWKLMQKYLSYEGIEINSPRIAIRKSFETEIISDAEGWLEMLESRNLSTHTYDEITAKEIYKNVAEKYIFLFENFNENMKKILDSQ